MKPYGVPSSRELPSVVAAHVAAFDTDPKGVRRWIARAGRRNFRVWRSGGEVVAACNLIPVGTWFGGRRVPMTGVAGVATAPEHRARGHGSALMAAAVREIAAAGTGLSGLYPATLPVYRRVGYEHAGTRACYVLPVASLVARDRDGVVRVARPSDRPAIRRLYLDLCRRSSGLLDRNGYMWWRVSGRGDPKFRIYVVRIRGRIEGYFALLREHRAEGLPYDLWLGDHAFATPEAGRNVLSFLAAHRSLAEDLLWHGGPADALSALHGEPAKKVKYQMTWMLRITDLRDAVEARGYPRGVAAEVHLDVEDPLVPRNAGRWVLRVAGGRGRLVRGGRGRVKASIAALAPVYSGFRSALEQAALGGLEGHAADLESTGAAFAGPPPWNREMY